jgi:hypothetical protein
MLSPGAEAASISRWIECKYFGFLQRNIFPLFREFYSLCVAWRVANWLSNMIASSALLLESTKIFSQGGECYLQEWRQRSTAFAFIPGRQSPNLSNSSRFEIFRATCSLSFMKSSKNVLQSKFFFKGAVIF